MSARTQRPSTSRSASDAIVIPRRSFLVALGLGGVGLALGLRDAEAEPAKPEVKPAVAIDGFRPNVFVHIAAGAGTVSIVCARSEMGQGVRSSLPSLIADELGADMTKVKVVQADGDKIYGDQNTDGSRSVRMDFVRLRKLGAVARMMLVEAAAKRWGVPSSTCTTEAGAVVHSPSNRTIGFGELVEAASKLPVPKDDAIVLRPRSELKLLGRELPLLDGPDIVTGKAIFGADVRLPGMLTAVVWRPPVVGAKVARFDDKKALAIAGVKRVVELPAPKRPFRFQPLGGVAVVAEDTWAAMKGRAALEITWSHDDNAAYDSTSFRGALEASVMSPGRVARAVGNVDEALAKASKRVVAVYHAAHLAHASMEPPVAVAKVDPSSGACEIWTSTQNPQSARSEVAQALGVDETKVTVHVTLLGGGFGRKSKPDYVVEAALVSKAVGAPVRLQWTREDDLQHDYYHAVSAQRLEAGLDASSAITAWYHRTSFTPIGSVFSDATSGGDGELAQGVLDTPLAIPNVRAENGPAKAHTRIGWLRSVANVYHAFAIQSFIDEIAHARGKDPKENLLEVLGPARIVTPKDLGVDKLSNYGQPLDEHPIDVARHRRVLERVCELARWDDRKAGHRALGLAVHRSFLTYVAVVVSVVRSDRWAPIRVDEVWTVADAGTIVNRERVRSQLEGATIFGLSNAMYGAITMKGGATEQRNFRDYRVMRLPESPRAVHVDIIESEGPPGGVGEPGVPPIAPALANAIFALTGTRVRELPMSRVVHL